MAKYLRRKSDGMVYDWNPYMAESDLVEAFEFGGQPPDRIPDLVAFLTKDGKPAGPARGVKLDEVS